MLRDDEGNRPIVAALPAASSTTCRRPRLYWGGVMHYVELDVKICGAGSMGDRHQQRAGCANGGGPGTTPARWTRPASSSTSRTAAPTAIWAPTTPRRPVVTTFAVRHRRRVPTPTTSRPVSSGSRTSSFPAANSAPNNALDGAFVERRQRPLRRGSELGADDRRATNAPGRGPSRPTAALPRLLPLPRPPATISPNRCSGCPTAASPRRQPVTTPTLYSPTPTDRPQRRPRQPRVLLPASAEAGERRPRQPAGNGSQGLTVASENPVYVRQLQRLHERAAEQRERLSARRAPAVSASAPSRRRPRFRGGDCRLGHVPLERVERHPLVLQPARPGHESAPFDAQRAARRTTWYRARDHRRQGLQLPRAARNNRATTATSGPTAGPQLHPLPGSWDGTLNYRGSIISLYMNRQAVGTYKCCNIVYGGPTRGYIFDTDFLQPTLLPPRTPMFRDINTLTFRQVLRPTQ